jgi:hypothetical protein
MRFVLSTSREAVHHSFQRSGLLPTNVFEMDDSRHCFQDLNFESFVRILKSAARCLVIIFRRSGLKFLSAIF